MCQSWEWRLKTGCTPVFEVYTLSKKEGAPVYFIRTAMFQLAIAGND